MTGFVFDDYARTTLGGAKTADGKPLSPPQLQQAIDYLKSPGSGSDGSTSYADYVARKMHAHPPKLGPGPKLSSRAARFHDGLLKRI